MSRHPDQPPGSPEAHESVTKIEVASWIGEGREPLPDNVTVEISNALLEADSIPVEQLGGMLARYGYIPAEELRAMFESRILAHEHGKEGEENEVISELRSQIYEQRMNVLRGLYQEGHDSRRSPGKVFRDVHGRGLFIATLASHDEGNGEETGNRLYFNGDSGRFWYENEQSRFRPDAASTNAAVAAFYANLRDGLAPIKCLSGACPIRCTVTGMHPWASLETSQTREEVWEGGSRQEAARDFINAERRSASEYYLYYAMAYDGTNWECIFSKPDNIDVSQGWGENHVEPGLEGADGQQLT